MVSAHKGSVEADVALRCERSQVKHFSVKVDAMDGVYDCKEQISDARRVQCRRADVLHMTLDSIRGRSWMHACGRSGWCQETENVVVSLQGVQASSLTNLSLHRQQDKLREAVQATGVLLWVRIIELCQVMPHIQPWTRRDGNL